LGRGFSILTGESLTYNTLDIHPGSKLDRDLSSPDPEVRSFFGPVAPHLVNFFEYAVLYDTRDNETSPATGTYDQVKVRVSPGGTDGFPYRYGQVNVTARFYATPVPRWLSVAFRIVGDGQFGDPPFYELARFEDTSALGGGKGVRGIPAQRYYGKVKLFGNLETRSRLADFKLFKNDVALGGAVFFDAGRLWSGWGSSEALDGSGVGLKYGVGLGLRLQQGKAFVVRGDLAWSPDARPIAGYFTAGHIF
jgi:outer membrane protein assembly factor BamA